MIMVIMIKKQHLCTWDKPISFCIDDYDDAKEEKVEDYGDDDEEEKEESVLDYYDQDKNPG